MINVQGIRRNVKNVVRNYSDAEVKVREATSNDPWGPSSTLMSEVADLTYNVVAFSEIMKMIWKRLNDHGKNWRHVYKALVLLEYLIKTGSEKVAQQCRENIFAIQTLKDFQYMEENKDQGMNVREKSKHLVALLKDNERLSNERARALKARERFVGADRYVTSSHRDSFGSPDGATSPGEFPGHVSSSELECARPQTSGEEELQLQLALAMSKEEAEQEERMRQNDELRLKMALTESEVGYGQTTTSKQSTLDDLLGLSLTNENQGVVYSSPTTADPWGICETAQLSVVTDPWGAPVSHPVAVTSRDPWSLPASSPSETTKPPVPANTPVAATDPWGGIHLGSTAPTDPWSSQPVMVDSLDAFAPTPPQRSKSISGELDDLDFRNLASENSPGDQRTLSPNPFELYDLRDSLSPNQEQPKQDQSRKTPESFLGPNANLVNLDALVSSKQTVQASSTVTNPFATQAISNPFETVRAPPPTINQLRTQNIGFTTEPTSVTGPSLPAPLLPLDGFTASSPLPPANNPFM
ncbi:epsin-2-like [Tachypleus tridentatus]|uniref:epsin-2-like n=1 Tax=Tachypleus tridentatus TaxID=6853 RepID=UPI003FCF7392